MRIEGVYTFPADVNRVFAALADPELLAQAIPGAEQIIQLGPPTAEGVITFEARVRLPAGTDTCSVTAMPVAARQPAHLRLELRGHAPSGPLSGQLTIDLVEDEARTIGAYVCDLSVAGFSGDDALATAQDVARTLCQRLSDGLRAREETAEARDALRSAARSARRRLSFTVRTPRGRIVTLPPLTAADEVSIVSWRQRLLWLGSGVALGMAVLSAILVIARRLAAPWQRGMSARPAGGSRTRRAHRET